MNAMANGMKEFDKQKQKKAGNMENKFQWPR